MQQRGKCRRQESVAFSSHQLGKSEFFIHISVLNSESGNSILLLFNSHALSLVGLFRQITASKM